MSGALYLAAGAARGLWRTRLRSALTVLAATIGVAGVVGSIAYARAGRRQVLEQIRRLGTNTLVVAAQPNRSIAGRARTGSPVTTLVERDYRSIRREVAGLVRSSGLVNRGLRVKGAGFSKVASVVGCEPAYFAIHSWSTVAGGLFDGNDMRRSRRVAVLGHTVARDLFGEDAGGAVGRRLFVDRVPFEVVGVLAERGQGLDLADVDAQVYVPLTAAMRRLLEVDSYSAILLETDGRQPADATIAAVGAVLRRRHRSSPKVPEDFVVQSQTALAEAQLAASRKLGFLVSWIGASALVVSDLGILAVAWIGGKARTVEIGTRRALGATARGIFGQLLLEAGLLAAAGCGLGLAGGWAGSLLLARRGGLGLVFDWREAALVLASALLLNLLFALLPSLRAARLEPMRALRYE
jgi:putative ABC transport system permease protein